MDAPVDIAHLRQWIGRRETQHDVAGATPPAALAATLDRDMGFDGDLPPLYHWLYFLPVTPMAGVGPDGHPARGGFLPPVPLPRRMWAASRLRFDRAIPVGATLSRISEITDVQLKDGQTGPLVFVSLRHELSADGKLAISEEQDIVYRDMPRQGEAPPPAKPAPGDAAWRREVQADAVRLFRYSALTFNGHRIHYDRGYATGTEGYPGLVVHAPLVATWLIDQMQRERPGARLAAYRFRALRPLFDVAPFRLCGQPAADGRSVHLWAEDAGGALCVDATATLA